MGSGAAAEAASGAHPPAARASHTGRVRRQRGDGAHGDRAPLPAAAAAPMVMGIAAADAAAAAADAAHHLHQVP